MLLGWRMAIGRTFVLVLSAGALLIATSALAQRHRAPRGPMPSTMPSPVPLPDLMLTPPSPSPSMMAPFPIPSPIPPAPVSGAQNSALSNEELEALYRRILKHYKASEYGQAVPLADKYVDSIETRVGDDDPSYAAAINLLAILKQAQGQFVEAKAYVKRALTIHEQLSGREHPDVAIDLNMLGQLNHQLGRFGEAGRMFKRALAINEKSLGLEHLNVARDLNNLAWLYQAQGRYADAEPHVKRALAIVEKELGPEEADVGRILDTLAKVYEGQGRVKDAEPLYRRALAILEKSLGPNHPGVAVTRENLGGLYKSQGRSDEAEPLLKNALLIKERVFGAHHPSVARTLTLLAELYRTEGRTGEAELLFLRALAISKAGIREVGVFYVTDRKPEKNAKTIAFGGERSQSLTFGQANVIVPKPEDIKGHARFALGPTVRNLVNTALKIKTTEMTRLSIRHIGILSDERQFIEAVKQRLNGSRMFPKHLFVFVHGYNVSFENALRRTAQIAYDLNFDGAPFLFSWPSRGSYFSYAYDRESASVAVNHLKEFLDRIVEQTDASKVHLIAHSMGNLVLLNALEKIKLSRGRASSPAFAEVVLHAPDVDTDRFRQLMKAIKGLSRKVTLYASKGDRALGFARLVWGFVSRAGRTPIVVADVETIDVTAAGSSFLGLNHDLYATNPTIFNDMRILLERSDHPPDKRSPAFQPVVTKDGTYWLYRQP